MALGSDAVGLAIGEHPTRLNNGVYGGMFELPNMQIDGSQSGGAYVDGRTTICKVVRNISGGALLPGRGVVFDTLKPGLGINAYAGSGERPDGFLDPWLPAAGVADDEYCLMVVAGPTLLRHSGGTAVAFDDECIMAANGQVLKTSADPPAVADVESMAGIAEEAASVSNAAFKANVKGIL